MKIGLFGGSFDPVHMGHLMIAELIREAVSLDTVWFIPTPQPPHKIGHIQTDFELRAEMLEAAIRSNPFFSINRIEDALPKPSYTVQTLRHLSEAHPDHQWYLIIGADSLVCFHLWHEPEAVLSLCTPVVYPRQGYPIHTLHPDLLNKTICPSLPLIDLSSTMIRHRLMNNQSVRYLVPDSVLETIERFRLYQKKTE